MLCGLGIGVASVAATTLGTSAVGERDRGTAAGLLNTAAQVGTALGIAALVLVAGAAPATASPSPSPARSPRPGRSRYCSLETVSAKRPV